MEPSKTGLLLWLEEEWALGPREELERLEPKLERPEPKLERELEGWLLDDLEDDLNELLEDLEDDLNELLLEELEDRELELCLLGGMGVASLRHAGCRSVIDQSYYRRFFLSILKTK